MYISRFIVVAAVAAIPLVTWVASAQAQPVNISGIVSNSCVLGISTGGTLAPSSDGRTMSSAQSGGLPGGFTLVAVGATPRVKFTAPVAETPAGFSGSAVASVRYTSLRGAQQDWTSTATTATAGALLDTFTVHGKIESDSGFASGRYNVQTVVTCEQ